MADGVSSGRTTLSRTESGRAATFGSDDGRRPTRKLTTTSAAAARLHPAPVLATNLYGPSWEPRFKGMSSAYVLRFNRSARSANGL